MLKSWKSAAAVAVPALALMALPAQARDGYYRGHRGGGDDAAIAIGAGVVGLALGAALASNSRDRGYYYDDGYYYPRGYYYRSYPRYYSYDYDYPRYQRQWNGWRNDGWGHNGWRHRDWNDHDGWGHHDHNRWGY
ncbi:MAG: hypothetical protein ABIM50_06220 [Novosphingobium sp.]